MKRLIVLVSLALFLVACDFLPQLAQTTPTQATATVTAESKPLPPQGKPGTLPASSPQGKQGTLPAQPQAKVTPPSSPQAKQGTLPAPKDGTALPPRGSGETAQPTSTTTVANPTSGVKLYVAIYAPKNASGKLPAVVLVPGGTGDSAGFTQINPRGVSDVGEFNNAGFVAIVFDPDGRGKSAGKEDYNGHIHQDGLAAVVRYAATLANVDAKQIGVLTYSYGITMGSGVLARYSDLLAKYLIDWEGPADRNDTTVDCRGGGRIAFQPCSDSAFWSEREALTFIAKVRVPYQRVQSEEDHVQPDNSHAVNMINAAVKGGVSWVRLNDYPANQTYDAKNPPKMLPETMDGQREATIIKYAQELTRR